MKKIIYALLILLLIQSNAMATETAEALYAKAYAHIYRNNTKTAISLFEKALVAYPDTAYFYAGTGDAYLKEDNYQKAMDYYTKAQRGKNTLDIYKIDFYNASTKLCMNDIYTATNTLLELTKKLDNPVVFENINYLLNEKYSKLKFINDIYTDDNNLEEANQLKQAGKNEKALQKYLSVYAQNPQNYKASNNAGVTLIELKDYQLAEKYLLQALAGNQNSALILNNLAVAKHYQNNFAEAGNYFKEAKKMQSDYGAIINNALVSNIQKELFSYKAENVNTILDIAKKDNENYYAWLILSRIYFLKGDYKSANNALSQLQSTYNSKLYYQKAYMAYKNKNYQNALTFINKALSLYSGNAYYYILRGRIYDAMDNYSSAFSDFNTVSAKDKNNSLVTYYNAKTLYNSGDKINATRMLKDFISTKKGNSQSTNINILFE